MTANHVLSALSRRLIYVTMAVFGLMGLVLYIAPAWAAVNFSWNISPMVAMTMGGWYLGSTVMAGLNGIIFPEPLSRFTLQSFGVFYFSLAFAALPLLRATRLAAITVHIWGGLALIALITAAALVYFRSFNFAQHPFQSIYLGVYLVALAITLVYLWSEHAHRKDLAAAG